MFCRITVGLAVVIGTLIAPFTLRAAEPMAPPPQVTSKSWIFDEGSYTNSPKTGERVWQYSQPQHAYRDPNALYDSPHGSYPFLPDVYDPYRYYSPYLYGITPYPAYHFPSFYGLPPTEAPYPYMP